LSPAGQSWVMETNASDNRRTREAVAVVDYPRFLQRINDFVCQADQPPRQVLIEAHILAVDLSEDCRHGVNFDHLMGLRSAAVTTQNIGFANPLAAPGFFVDVNGTGLDALVEMLQTTTDAKTLASPRVHAVSGQTSRIQIGGQLGFRVTTTTQTSSLESVQFLDVGVVLEVTPRITRDGRVLMKILPKVSTGEVDSETGLPSEETTEVMTDALVQSGQGLVIGGLIQERDSVVANKVPLLGDIPYAGMLFQRRQKIKQRTEIIVTLRPHVLPYAPVVAARCDQELLRAELPLTQGAICRFPRPFEPRMSDACDNPQPLFHRCPPECASVGCDPRLIALPPVEDCATDGNGGYLGGMTTVDGGGPHLADEASELLTPQILTPQSSGPELESWPLRSLPNGSLPVDAAP
ncbi:MAG: type II secretion system protein GspD, partial [Planctomycetales bacterium]|nr:type II secretion system protein GspD [Planctomycetales bacterium]